MTLGSYINATAQQAPPVPVPLQAAPAPLPASPMPPQAVQAAPSEQLDQMVAPIALYPDALIAQILAASTYPTEIVMADRFILERQGLTGSQLAQAVDHQNWDPSVKALIQFPSILANMDKNLSWTTALGVAYAQQPQDVMGAIQSMRIRAEQAGTLKSCAQEQVITEGSSIVIQPPSPQAVYVPQYNPWIAYGPPVAVYPGWVSYPGLYTPDPGVLFGAAVGLAVFTGFGWGWGHWGTDWHGHNVVFNHNIYRGHGPTLISHSFNHGFVGHPGGFHHGVARNGFRPGGFGHAGFGGHHGSPGGFHGGRVGFHGGGFHGGGFHGGGGHGGGHGHH
jgi:hypothetical protein